MFPKKDEKIYYISYTYRNVATRMRFMIMRHVNFRGIAPFLCTATNTDQFVLDIQLSRWKN